MSVAERAPLRKRQSLRVALVCRNGHHGCFAGTQVVSK